MLKSDQRYLAQFALDPRMEHQFDDVEHVFMREDDILSVIEK